MSTQLIRVVLLLSIAGLLYGQSSEESMNAAQEWLDSLPANCPHENPETHVCSSLTSSSGTCATIHLCRGDPTELEIGDFFDDDMCDFFGVDSYICGTWCVSFGNCTVYTCERYCCDGWTIDEYRRCVNHSGEMECRNGGSLVMNYYGRYECFCSRNFTGRHCEKPICHCENGGACVAINNRTACTCGDGFYGERCEKTLCTMQCENGGTCLTDGYRQYCECPHIATGKLCQHIHINDEECPAPDFITRNSTYCAEDCYRNTDCYDDMICCSDGCNMLCKNPKSRTCVEKGRPLAVGTVFKPDPCTTCNCTSTGNVICYTIDCAYPMCLDGQNPIFPAGECCPRCPEDNHPLPSFRNCPRIVELYLPETSSVVYPTDNDLRELDARDYNGQKLKVHLDPSRFRHCKCINTWKNYAEATATAVDAYGQKAVCSFKVHVNDRTPPMISSCVDDIYVFEDEIVEITKIDVYDNVGIAGTNYSSKLSVVSEGGRLYPIGTHSVRYDVWDFDFNRATCYFLISISSRDTDFKDLPEGLRQRSRPKESSHAAIVVPLAVLMPIVIMIIIIILCLYKRRLRRSASRASENYTIAQARAPKGLKPKDAFDNTIYTVCGSPNMKLPAYTLPSNPPPYSTSSLKDDQYTYIAPPTYEEVGRVDGVDNGGYETLEVATSDVADRK